MMVDMYMFFHQAAKIRAGIVSSKSFFEGGNIGREKPKPYF
jgi:hypothetical protein